jgi:hypothetical protein
VDRFALRAADVLPGAASLPGNDANSLDATPSTTAATGR